MNYIDFNTHFFTAVVRSRILIVENSNSFFSQFLSLLELDMLCYEFICKNKIYSYILSNISIIFIFEKTSYLIALLTICL